MGRLLSIRSERSAGMPLLPTAGWVARVAVGFDQGLWVATTWRPSVVALVHLNDPLAGVRSVIAALPEAGVIVSLPERKPPLQRALLRAGASVVLVLGARSGYGKLGEEETRGRLLRAVREDGERRASSSSIVAAKQGA